MRTRRGKSALKKRHQPERTVQVANEDTRIPEAAVGITASSNVSRMNEGAAVAGGLDIAWNGMADSPEPGTGRDGANDDEGLVSCAPDQDENGPPSSRSTNGSGGWDGYDGITSSHSGGSPTHMGRQHPRAGQDGSDTANLEGVAPPTCSSTTDDSGSWDGFAGSNVNSASVSVLWVTDAWGADDEAGGTVAASVEYPGSDAIGRDQDGSWIPQVVDYFCRDGDFESSFTTSESTNYQHEEVPAPPCWETTVAGADEQDGVESRATAGEVSGFGASQASLNLKILLNIDPVPALPAAEAGAAKRESGFGQTPGSQTLKALLGVQGFPLPTATSFGTNHRSHALKQFLGVKPPAGKKPEAAAESNFGRTLPSLKLKNLLGVGLLGSDETGWGSSMPAARGAARPVVAPAAGGGGVGAADGDAIRPPPGFEPTYMISNTLPISAAGMAQSRAVGVGRSPASGMVQCQFPTLDFYDQSPPPGFGPSPPPGFESAPTLDFYDQSTPPGFGPSPPPGFESPPPPGFEPYLPLSVDMMPSSVALHSNDVVASTPSPVRSGGSYDQSPDSQPSASSGTDGGRFGFMADLARMDDRVAELGSLLGRGGCAEVYRIHLKGADHQREVDEYTGGSGLVLKTVPKEHCDMMAVAMKREIAIVETFPPRCHPNVMDIVSTSREKLCMVMPAAVCDIESLFAQKRALSVLSAAERMRMAAGAARGLHYLHSELGLVHADVKPENMLMTRDKVIKIADFGLSGWRKQGVAGLTKQYAAPEAVATFMRPELPKKTMMQPSLDTYSFAIVMIQMLYLEENPRLGDKALVTHRLTPPHPSFDTALNNARQLRELFEATGSAQDEQRMQDARRMYFDMHEDYAAQPIRMGNLRDSILDQSRWKQPGGQQLRFEEEVTLVLLSALNKNPRRRVSLDTLVLLLESCHLWAPAGAVPDDDDHNDDDDDDDSDTSDAPALPQDVRDVVETTIRDGLLADPSLDAGSGVWWKASQFESPWWEHPPPVESIVVSKD